jgi:hypothetical protein
MVEQQQIKNFVCCPRQIENAYLDSYYFSNMPWASLSNSFLIITPPQQQRNFYCNLICVGLAERYAPFKLRLPSLGLKVTCS